MIPNTYGAASLEALKNGAEQLVVINVTPRSGSPILLTGADIMSGTLHVNNSGSTGSDIELGAVCAAQLEFTLYDPNGTYSNVNFNGAAIDCVLNWVYNNSMDALPLFSGTIDSTRRKRDTISLVALDKMVKLDQPYVPSDFVSYTTPMALALAIVNQIGLSIDNNHQAINTTDPIVPYEGTDVTLRQVLSWCCSMMGCCARCKTDGTAIQLVWYDGSTVLPKSDRHASDIADSPAAITGVKFVNGETETTVGTDDYMIVVDNPLPRLPAVALSNIYNRLIALGSYYAFSAETLTMPWIQPFDRLIYGESAQNGLPVLVMDTDFTVNGRTSMSGKADGAEKKGYASLNPLTEQQSRILKEYNEQTNQHITDAEGALLSLNELIANGMGLYVIEEPTGSGKYYYADTPDLDDASFIITINTGGFAFTDDWNDGSPVWQYGISRDGNAVINRLYAYLISANIVRTGVLESESGNYKINLDQGWQRSLKNNHIIDEIEYFTVAGDDCSVGTTASWKFEQSIDASIMEFVVRSNDTNGLVGAVGFGPTYGLVMDFELLQAHLSTLLPLKYKHGNDEYTDITSFVNSFVAGVRPIVLVAAKLNTWGLYRKILNSFCSIQLVGFDEGYNLAQTSISPGSIETPRLLQSGGRVLLISGGNTLTDADDEYEADTFEVPTDAAAGSISNLPVSKAGRLIVETINNENWTTLQTYKTKDGRVYYRRFDASEQTPAWTPWTTQDFLVESGTSNGFTYELWASGKAECWGTHTIGISATTTNIYSGGWYVDIGKTINLPRISSGYRLFAHGPATTITPRYNGSQIILALAQSVSTGTVKFNLATPYQLTDSTNFAVYVHCIGDGPNTSST